MSRLLKLRVLSPALLDFSALTYMPLNVQGWKCFHTGAPLQRSDNTDSQINPVFINRNPRCLEKLGLEPKRKGWKFQAPRKDYYNKLIFETSNHHTSAQVEHWTGKTVVQVTTRDWSLAKHLYSTTDVCAAANVGKMLARRCLEAGLTNIFYDPDSDHENSSKLKAFLKALEDGQITLQEPAEVEHEYRPGIDYDNPPEYSPDRKHRDDIQPVGGVYKPS